jgi:hypothetical protein
MTAARTITIPISLIRDDAEYRYKRPTNPDVVRHLAVHRKNGAALPRPAVRSAGEHYELVHGAHLVASATEAGENEIDVVLVEGDELDLALRGIAENVHRNELAGPMRDAAIAHACHWIEKRYGKPARGAPQKNAAPRRNSHAEVAKLFMLNVRGVERALKRYSGLIHAANDAYANGDITQVAADGLAVLTPQQQREFLPKVRGQDGKEVKRLLNEAKAAAAASSNAEEPSAATNESVESLVDGEPTGPEVRREVQAVTRSIEKLSSVLEEGERPTASELDKLRDAVNAIRRLLDKLGVVGFEVVDDTEGLNPQVSLDECDAAATPTHA